MFFATLICALLLGLSYGVLFIGDKKLQLNFKGYNKAERIFLKIPKPPIKIFISLLLIAVVALCWIEATYLADSIGIKLIFLILNGMSVYIIALFMYTLLHPYLLKDETALTLCNKYYLAHNLGAMILFVILSITALWLQNSWAIEWNIGIIGVAGLAVGGIIYILYLIAAILFFIFNMIRGLCRLIKWLHRTYWKWVLEH